MKPQTTIYRGIRVAPEERTVSDSLVYANDRVLSPAPSQKIRNHSPDGFNWGYGGSGPAQLALAILLDYYGEENDTIWRQYQKFKWSIIANLPQEKDWMLTGEEIEREMFRIL